MTSENDLHPSRRTSVCITREIGLCPSWRNFCLYKFGKRLKPLSEDFVFVHHGNPAGASLGGNFCLFRLRKLLVPLSEDFLLVYQEKWSCVPLGGPVCIISENCFYPSRRTSCMYQGTLSCAPLGGPNVRITSENGVYPSRRSSCLYTREIVLYPSRRTNCLYSVRKLLLPLSEDYLFV